MAYRFRCLLLLFCSGLGLGLRADPPPLLVQAFDQWASGRDDLAFTQRTRFFFDDGRVKAERLERFDPSLPDSKRWRLLEIDGKPATDQQRKLWEAKKNRKPRKRVAKVPSDYVDMEHAVLLEETPEQAFFEIRLRQDAARLLGVARISAIVTVDKKSGSIVHVTSALHQPMRVLMGLARITDLDVDVHLDPATDEAGDVKTGSTAYVAISELGTPIEYTWSDFTRVTPFRPAASSD
jgi:hypothetical protein